jgi:hypothetical protein
VRLKNLEIIQTWDAPPFASKRTLASCGEGNLHMLPAVHQIVRNINEFGPPAFNHVADVKRIRIEMPYRRSPDNRNHPPPNALCFAVHVPGEGWRWHPSPISPERNDALQFAFAEFDVNESQVDAIGILFDEVACVNEIRFTAKRK